MCYLERGNCRWGVGIAPYSCNSYIFSCNTSMGLSPVISLAADVQKIQPSHSQQVYRLLRASRKTSGEGFCLWPAPSYAWDEDV